MSDYKRLAIIIPAYKPDFFDETLSSIINQTCKDFNLYIGDDNSPHDLNKIINNYIVGTNITYKKFDSNLGGQDLVSQWNRCINLTQNEEWLWLFSDDDVMEPNCVEVFYNYLNQYTTDNLFHFNVKVINEKNEIIGKYLPFPKTLKPEQFFSKRIRYEISSFVVEYIFSRQMYLRQGGFQKFDLAWSSDDATWIKFSSNKGITTLPDALVKWRYSGINISSKIEDKQTLLRKLKASEDYILWATNFFNANGIVDSTSKFEKMKWVLAQFIQTRALNLKEKWQYIKELLHRLDYNDIKVKMVVYLAYMETKKRWLTKKNKSFNLN